MGIILVQIIALPALSPHMLVLPFMLLSVLAASELVRRRPMTIVFWLALALFLGHGLDPGYYGDRGVLRSAQLEALDYVLSNTDEDTPVQTGSSGIGNFGHSWGTL